MGTNSKMASKTTDLSFNDKVHRLVKQIPKGKVVTYGQIAIAIARQTRFGGHLQTGFGARAVGNALHSNTDSNVPCHRVVDRNGRIALSHAFGGWKEQKRRLLTEGVRFRDNMHVDLEQCKFTLGFAVKCREFSFDPALKK